MGTWATGSLRSLQDPPCDPKKVLSKKGWKTTVVPTVNPCQFSRLVQIPFQSGLWNH